MAFAAALEEIAFNRCVIQPAARRMLIGGQPASIGARAFDLLMALVERRERLVTKNELLDVVWPGVVVEENNLQVHISALRKLLGPSVIATVPGRGYRFTAGLNGETQAQAAAQASNAAAQAIARAATGNLPLQLPAIFGRDADVRALVDLIESHRLVTVVGAAGMGKSTLALAAAHALRERWSGGAWMVDLGPVAEAAQMAHAVVQALRIALAGAGSPQEQLVGLLQSQSLLLILQNCEHLVDAVGALAGAVLERAPGVRLLATSQELLNVPGEKLFKLQALAVPEADQAFDAERYGALRLFAERAQAADPRFALSASNASAVAEICRRLDGLPLAIELAAARVRLLGVNGLRDRLGERFRVLTGGARNATRRHQTLQAAIDWSYALLSAEEQVVLRRLGVFSGGFTLELAQQVVGDERIDEWGVLDALGALVDKSLVAANAEEPPRYRLLETTRAYALERLADAGEAPPVLARHARAVAGLFVATDEQRFGEAGTLNLQAFIRHLAPELDNVRAALQWATSEAGDGAVAVALAGASAEVFRLLGLSPEALRLMQALQDRVDERAQPDAAALFWSGLNGLGGNGRLPKAALVDSGARAERIYRQCGSRRRLYCTRYRTAWSLSTVGEHDAAEVMLAQIAALEDPAWPGWVRCLRLNLRAGICIQRERYPDALALLEEQRTLLEREVGEEASLIACQTQMSLALSGLGRHEEAVALARSTIERSGGQRSDNGFAWVRMMTSLTHLGRLDEADRTLRQAMDGWRRDGLLLYICGVLAWFLAEQGRYTDAARVDGASQAFIERSGIAQHPLLKRARAQMQARFEAARLDPAALRRWRVEGERLDEAALAAVCLRVRAS